MTVYQAIFLAVVQGLTEFLPVSSSGHLVLFQKIFQLSEPPVLFDVLLHLGTLGAVLIYLRREIIFLIKEWKENIGTWKFLIIGTIPAVIVGLVLNKAIDEVFNSLKLVGLTWLVMGAGLLLTKRINREDLKKELKNVKNKDALVIGIFQAFALLPGISRSGSTIFGGLVRKLNPQTAFTFSFLLAIPAILGATTLQLINNKTSSVDLLNGVLPMFMAGLVGFFTLKFLQKTLISQKFYLFGYYCLLLAVITLVFFL